ncbi:MAG: acyltransferase, partial [Bacteroidetes bacterium]|nr:acyltransferase [Bacteroidota bacterium]
MNTTSPNYSKTRNIPQLDGIRGIALMLVLFSHYLSFKTIFAAGWCGVDLFFVLSGFLITNRLLNAYKKPYYFSRFYRNRFLRIVPLYFSVLLIFYTAIHFFVKDPARSMVEIYTTHWKSFFLFFENWTFIFYGRPNAGYLLHFWSLAVEEQFYLVWPFLLYILPSFRLRIKVYVFLIVLVLATRCFIYYHHSDWAEFQYYYFNTFCRIDSFIIGALFSEIEFNKIKLRLNFVYMMIFFCFACIVISALICRNVAFSNPFFGT